MFINIGEQNSYSSHPNCIKSHLIYSQIFYYLMAKFPCTTVWRFHFMPIFWYFYIALTTSWSLLHPLFHTRRFSLSCVQYGFSGLPALRWSVSKRISYLFADVAINAMFTWLVLVYELLTVLWDCVLQLINCSHITRICLLFCTLH